MGKIKKFYNTLEIIKNIWNYVEDRRIEQYVFNQKTVCRVITEVCTINTSMIG